jgi:hypothetical protein
MLSFVSRRHWRGFTGGKFSFYNGGKNPQLLEIHALTIYK